MNLTPMPKIIGNLVFDKCKSVLACKHISMSESSKP